MREREILKQLDDRRDSSHPFVKWWRKEQDFLDFDLVERFEENAAYGDIGGFELLTLEDMWKELKRIAGARVNLLDEPSGSARVEWVHRGKKGEQVQVCDFTPKTVMTIYDVETKGNPVDS